MSLRNAGEAGQNRRQKAAVGVRWQVVAASVQGVSHAKKGLPCQDNHYAQALPGGRLIAAVADGVSSAPHSAVGATVAANAAVKHLTAALPPSVETPADWSSLLANSLRRALLRVEKEAQKEGVDAMEMASTLILIAATPESVAVAQIGNGAVVVSDAAGRVFALTIPQRGEYANDTFCLTTPHALETAQIVIHPGKAACLAVFTDGLEECAMPADTPFAPFFAPLFRFVAERADAEEARSELEAFLRSSRITERTDDDVTLLLATLL